MYQEFFEDPKLDFLKFGDLNVDYLEDEELARSVDLGGITRTEFEEKLKQLKKELLDKIDEKIQAAMTNVGGLLGGLVSNRNSDIYRDYDY